jgi:hypothetical protein
MFLPRVKTKYCVMAAFSVSQIEHMAQTIMDKFFHEWKLPMPHFKIVNSLTSKNLGTARWNPKDPDTSTIELQKSIVGDEETLRKVLTHELIHHYEYMHPAAPDEELMSMGLKPAQHGEEFLDLAKKINAIMGDGYVSVKSDQSYVQEGVKEFYVLIEPADGFSSKGKFAYSWAVTPSVQQKEKIEQEKVRSKARLVKTKDIRFTRGPKIQRYGKIAIPKDDATQEKLKNMYEGAA